MQLQYMYTRLNVENFKACKAFYQDILELPVKFADDADEYVEFDTGAVLITLFNRTKVAEFVSRDESLSYDPHSAQVVLSFKVDDLRQATLALQEKGIEMLAPLTSYPERGFISTCFRDPDGNLIELEQMTDIMIS